MEVGGECYGNDNIGCLFRSRQNVHEGQEDRESV